MLNLWAIYTFVCTLGFIQLCNRRLKVRPHCDSTGHSFCGGYGNSLTSKWVSAANAATIGSDSSTKIILLLP